MRISRIAAAALLVSCLTGAAGCSQQPLTTDQGGDPSSAGATVTVRNMEFTPKTVTIKAGQSVTWKFDDGDIRHDVTADDDSFASKAAVGGHYTHKFTKPGKFGYDCSIHPSMRGTVVVKPAA